MHDFTVGYAQVNINPMLGIGVSGYYVPRFAKGYLDDLQASALALSLDGNAILLINVDNLAIASDLSSQYRQDIAAATGVPFENLFLAASHSHTAPLLENKTVFPADIKDIEVYVKYLGSRLVDVAKLSLQDLMPGKMGYYVGHAPDRIAYIRRYKMKDGTTMTCPPIDDPNIDHPIGTLDQRVNVLRFDRDGGESLVLANYGIHADTIGGDMNDTEISFDNETKSPGMARFVGRAWQVLFCRSTTR